MDNINKKIAVSLVGITIVTYLILSFMTADIKDEEAGSDYTQVYRYYRLFPDLFKGLGYKLEWYYKSSLPDNDGVIIFFDYSEQDQNSLDELTAWAGGGGILFFIGIDTEKDPIAGNTLSTGPLGKIVISKTLSKDVSKISIKEGKYMIEPPAREASGNEELPQEDIQDRAPEEAAGEQQEPAEEEVFEWYPLISGGDGTILFEMAYRKGKIFVLSESSLLSNLRMKDENTAVLFNNLLKPYYNKNIYLIQRSIFFTQYSYSYKPNSPLQFLFKKPVLFATLQVILMAVLFALWKGSRFGNPVRYDLYARRTLTEHLKAVGVLYRKSKTTGVVGSINKEYFIFKLRKTLGLSRKTAAESIVESLGRRLPGEKAELERLLSSKENLPEFQLLLNESRREKIIAAIRSKSVGKKQIKLKG